MPESDLQPEPTDESITPEAPLGYVGGVAKPDESSEAATDGSTDSASS
jgi:hypothetical protein